MKTIYCEAQTVTFAPRLYLEACQVSIFAINFDIVNAEGFYEAPS